jgi:hypothetical protein
MSANDKQVAGTHYHTTTGALQHWDYCDANDVPYLESACTKYVLRWRKKNGIQDLLKAQHYLEKRLENLAAGVGAPRGGTLNHTDYLRFALAHNLDSPQLALEYEIISYVLHWGNAGDLESAQLALEELLLLAQAEDDLSADADSSYVDQD